PGDPIATLIQMDKLRVEGDVDALRYPGQIRKGAPVQVKIYTEESEFDLHTHTVELQVDGSLQSIQTILREITNQGWLMTTKELSMAPTSVRESPMSLELRLVLYGLAPRQQEQYEEFAHRPFGSSIR
ncbi:unnamed protein product, partial [marine sediment metagenome]